MVSRCDFFLYNKINLWMEIIEHSSRHSLLFIRTSVLAYVKYNDFEQGGVKLH